MVIQSNTNLDASVKGLYRNKVPNQLTLSSSKGLAHSALA